MSSPPEICNPKIYEVIRENNSAVKEWINFAIKFIKLYFYEYQLKPSPEEIVNDVILKTYRNERRWNSEKVNIRIFMYYNIRSHTLALAKREKKYIPADVYDDEEESYKNIFEEAFIISKEEIEAVQDRKDKLETVLTAIKNDDDCQLVFYCIQDGHGTKDIAKYLGITVPEVNNILRRIKYKVQKALEQKTD